MGLAIHHIAKLLQRNSYQKTPINFTRPNDRIEDRMRSSCACDYLINKALKCKYYVILNNIHLQFHRYSQQNSISKFALINLLLTCNILKLRLFQFPSHNIGLLTPTITKVLKSVRYTTHLPNMFQFSNVNTLKWMQFVLISTRHKMFTIGIKIDNAIHYVAIQNSPCEPHRTR